MAALDAIGARLAGRTIGRRRSARDHGCTRVRSLCTNTKAVHPLLDGLKQVIQFGGDYAIEPDFVTHAWLPDVLATNPAP
jgi:hypothetical protein